jgi:hypothetical protein
MERLVESLGVTSLSNSQLSVMAAELDEPERPGSVPNPLHDQPDVGHLKSSWPWVRNPAALHLR